MNLHWVKFTYYERLSSSVFSDDVYKLLLFNAFISSLYNYKRDFYTPHVSNTQPALHDKEVLPCMHNEQVTL